MNDGKEVNGKAVPPIQETSRVQDFGRLGHYSFYEACHNETEILNYRTIVDLDLVVIRLER